MKMGILYGAFDDKYGKSIKSGAKETKNKWVYKNIKLRIYEEKSDLDYGL